MAKYMEPGPVPCRITPRVPSTATVPRRVRRIQPSMVNEPRSTVASSTWNRSPAPGTLENASPDPTRPGSNWTPTASNPAAEPAPIDAVDSSRCQNTTLGPIGWGEEGVAAPAPPPMTKNKRSRPSTDVSRAHHDLTTVFMSR